MQLKVNRFNIKFDKVVSQNNRWEIKVDEGELVINLGNIAFFHFVVHFAEVQEVFMGTRGRKTKYDAAIALL